MRNTDHPLPYSAFALSPTLYDFVSRYETTSQLDLFGYLAMIHSPILVASTSEILTQTYRGRTPPYCLMTYHAKMK